MTVEHVAGKNAGQIMLYALSTFLLFRNRLTGNCR